MKFSKIFIVGGRGVMGKLLLERIIHFYTGDVTIFDKGDGIVIPDGDEEHRNLVIVATPISAIGPTLEKIAAIDPKFTFVTEIGSVKGELWAEYIRVMSRLSHKSSFFASTHPMVGPLAKDWHVFDWKKKCIIISGSTESTEAHAAFADFWADLGFINEFMNDAKRHDEVIGILSHLSHFMVMMYVRHAKQKLTPTELALAGTSFETFSKMAEGAERLIDIYDANNALPDLVDDFCSTLRGYEKQPKIEWFPQEPVFKKRQS